MKRIVVFGATGMVGTTLIELLVEKEPTWGIVAVSRSGPPPPQDATSNKAYLSKLPNVTIVKGDAENEDDTKGLCKDASIVFSCIGYPDNYQAKYWSLHFPKLTKSLLQATSHTKLVFCDNLYAYGHTANISPTKTKRVEAKLGSKFGVRAVMHEMFLEHMKEHPNSLAIVGASDFFGPRATKMSALGDIFIGNMVKGTQPMSIGSCTVLHDACFVPDVAVAMHAASKNAKSYGKFWIAPHAIQDKTLEQLAHDVSRLLKSETTPKVSVLPSWALKALGFFDGYVGSGMLYEMIEMLPWWINDYGVDDSDFVQTFQVEATPYEKALQTTIEYFQKQQET